MLEIIIVIPPKKYTAVIIGIIFSATAPSLLTPPMTTAPITAPIIIPPKTGFILKISLITEATAFD